MPENEKPIIVQLMEIEEKQHNLELLLLKQNSRIVDYCEILSGGMLSSSLIHVAILINFVKESTDIVEQNEVLSRLAVIIDDLYETYSTLALQINTANLNAEPISLKLNDCLSVVMKDLASEIEQCGAVIETDFGDAPEIFFSLKYLYNIFHSLIKSSLRSAFLVRRPVIDFTSIKLKQGSLLCVSSNCLELVISATEDGFSRLGHLFHKYPDQTGYNLYLINSQIAAMGGKVWIENVAGSGSIFFIQFNNIN